MDDPVHPVFRLMVVGVPITLLLDLVSPLGPDSAAIAARERELLFA